MKYYDLSPGERELYRKEINKQLLNALSQDDYSMVIDLFGHNDTHTRKVAYLELGKLYKQRNDVDEAILQLLDNYKDHPNEKIRQTVVYAAGEIACINFNAVENLVENGLNDAHHSVRNASAGALKTAGSKNPDALRFCFKHIQSPEPEVRRLVCHGLELRGRTHPQEITPLLKLLQYDTHKRVQDMLVHVLGQISYKKDCFPFVLKEVRSWENKIIYEKYKKEVIEVHERYSKFSHLTVEEVKEYLI